ncbi:hypothetical protein [Gordonia crocea]|uniref:Uncharacterized protein n=1 Tax=Gordonia crocea TaxID=589162 RepID=A0A7I9UZB7_9ACTN|nr:hypothetical protein [Gordonia crocea]GED98518.1 hypothetical protein nbrc107697_25570 [Gordonia crocea]
MAAAVVAVIVGATGCTVTGQAQTPRAQVESYVAERSAAREHANGEAACATTLAGMRASVAAYNTMISALNSSQDMGSLGGADRAVIIRLDHDLANLRAAQGKSLPAGLTQPFAGAAEATSAIRKAVVGKKRDELNPAARRWDRARQRLVRVCGRFLPR